MCRMAAMNVDPNAICAVVRRLLSSSMNTVMAAALGDSQERSFPVFIFLRAFNLSENPILKSLHHHLAYSQLLQCTLFVTQ